MNKQTPSPLIPIVPILAGMVLLLQILLSLLIVVLVVSFLTGKKNPFKKLANVIGQNSIPLTFLIATCATLGSLVLSELALFPPCELCWYQRIFMYPQVIILGVATFLNDARARIYALILSAIGLGIAVYHILVQLYPGMFQCSGEVAKCSAKQLEYFGYITIPAMSATAFAAIIIILLFSFVKRK